jgi:hypothetical protein
MVGFRGGCLKRETTAFLFVVDSSFWQVCGFSEMRELVFFDLSKAGFQQESCVTASWVTSNLVF